MATGNHNHLITVVDLESFSLIPYSLNDISSVVAVSHKWMGPLTSWPNLKGVSWKVSFDTVYIVCHFKTQYRIDGIIRYIWMDTVCINQDDQSDIERHIPLMSTIYSKCFQCHAFIYCPEKYELIVDFMETISEGNWKAVMRLHKASGLSVSEIQQLVNEALDGLEWCRRVWTFQERVLPLKVGYYFFRTQGRAMEQVASFPKRKLLNGWKACTRSLTSEDGKFLMNALGNMARNFSPFLEKPGAESATEWSLADVLYETSKFRCTVAADRLYGLLGFYPSVSLLSYRQNRSLEDIWAEIHSKLQDHSWSSCSWSSMQKDTGSLLPLNLGKISNWNFPLQKNHFSASFRTNGSAQVYGQYLQISDVLSRWNNSLFELKTWLQTNDESQICSNMIRDSARTFYTRDEGEQPLANEYALDRLLEHANRYKCCIIGSSCSYCTEEYVQKDDPRLNAVMEYSPVKLMRDTHDWAKIFLQNFKITKARVKGLKDPIFVFNLDFPHLLTGSFLVNVGDRSGIWTGMMLKTSERNANQFHRVETVRVGIPSLMAELPVRSFDVE